MFKISLLILCTMLLPSQFVFAANACPVQHNNTEIKFEMITGEPSYDHSHSSAQINRLSKKQLGKNWYQAGLTVAKLQYQQSINVTYYDLGRGQYCMRLSGVDFKLGYTDVNVYIDKKYPRNSCEFASVLDHENRHVLVNITTLKKHFPIIEREMKNFIHSLKPVHFRKAEQQAVTEQLKAKLQKQMMQLVNAVNNEVQRGNAAMDTKANYLKEQAQCSNW
ncbi:hypothetical protein [Oceanospirillum multiglobuliferum]|nr:hypothetical protein [Oceanospirillum multiglobuliferum]